MIKYVCKYTPLEIFKGFDSDCQIADKMASDFELAGRLAHDNMCGFGKSLLQQIIESKTEELILVNCCDTICRMYDVIKTEGVCKFTFLMELPHRQDCCSVNLLANELKRLIKEYEEYSGIKFDRNKFIAAISDDPLVKETTEGEYIGILGVRCGQELENYIKSLISGNVKNMTCVRNRKVFLDRKEIESLNDDQLFMAYARGILMQFPCGRMGLLEERRKTLSDPNLKGIIYHTIKFCDYYEYEYVKLKNETEMPILKLETDFTMQSQGQLKTRIEAFAEALSSQNIMKKKENVKKNDDACETEKKTTGKYYAGIDSGSTSTDVVIMDADKKIVGSIIIPTGGGASLSAEKALGMALEQSGIRRDDIAKIIKTGYGRDYIEDGDESVTEISCHAKGAHYLCPDAGTVIDIGGQDSKAIRLDEKGAVLNFVMNDKCAAGTGRFLEMMARTLGLTLEEMSSLGLSWDEDITISSMCTVFAESEVVSLVAQNKSLKDIIHGLNNSVAAKVVSLVKRVNPGERFIMTGGVANNAGVVKALEEKLGTKLFICSQAQICGAIGAALYAMEKDDK